MGHGPTEDFVDQKVAVNVSDYVGVCMHAERGLCQPDGGRECEWVGGTGGVRGADWGLCPPGEGGRECKNVPVTSGSLNPRPRAYCLFTVIGMLRGG